MVKDRIWHMVNDYMTERFVDSLKIVVAALAATWFSAPQTFQILLVLMLLDFVAGVLAAGSRQEIASAVAWRGASKKAFVWIIIGAISALQSEFSDRFPLILGEYTPAQVVAVGFAFGEAVSIIENAERVGVRVPFLRRFLEETRKRLQLEEDE